MTTLATSLTRTRAIPSTRAFGLGVLAVLLPASACVAATVGAVELTVGEVVAVIAERLGIGTSGVEPLRVSVLLDIRLPRIALGMLVGGGLAVAGATLQGLLRNPLADPGIVGTSSGAALAAAIAIVLFEAASPWLLPTSAFAGALAATVVVVRMARVGTSTDVTLLLLLGIAMNALCGVGLGVATYVADDAQLRNLAFWQLGSLAGAGWSTTFICAACIVPAGALLARDATRLNALALGERDAWQLGVDVEQLKKRAVVLSSLCVGAAVAAAGVVGFVGLAAPHVVRLVGGPDHRNVLPGAILGGALLVVVADVLARTVVIPAELPIGIVTSAIGTPVLFSLLHQHRQKANP